VAAQGLARKGHTASLAVDEDEPAIGARVLRELLDDDLHKTIDRPAHWSPARSPPTDDDAPFADVFALW
jgi:hypothetical protein